MDKETLEKLVTQLVVSKVNMNEIEEGGRIFVVLPLKDDVATVEVVNTKDEISMTTYLTSTVIDSSLNFIETNNVEVK